MFPGESHRLQVAGIERIKDERTLFGEDEQSPAATRTNHCGEVVRISKGHGWQIYHLYEFVGNRCPMERLR